MIGETPELFFGILIVLVAIFAIPKGSILAPVAMVALVVITVAISLWVELQRKVRKIK